MTRRDVPVWATPEDSVLLTIDSRPGVTAWIARAAPDRRKGLLGTSAIAGALWIERCNSVHTFGMAYAIDVVMVDKAGTVVAVRTMQPRRIGRVFFSARAAVELMAGEAATLGIDRGTRLGTMSANVHH